MISARVTQGAVTAMVLTSASTSAKVLDVAARNTTPQPPASRYNFGDGLKYDSTTNTLSVDTSDEVAEDDTRPITSAAVFVEVGNINALLQTI